MAKYTDGLGSTPMGVGPYGLGTPTGAPVPGGVLFRDVNTGKSLTGKQIDPATKDYVYDSNGRALGAASMQQIVQLAISTALQSSATPSQGLNSANLDKITDNYQQEVRGRVETALKPHIDAQRITLDAVTLVRQRDGRTLVSVRWTDLTTQQLQETTV